MNRRMEWVRIRSPLRYADGLELQRVHGAELERDRTGRAKLFLLQHTPVYTLGRKTESVHIQGDREDLKKRTRADVVEVERGGSVTYHGPGQLMAYLLLNLQTWGLGIHQHLDLLEEATIRAIATLGVNGRRVPGMTGVWAGEPPHKICAIGVGARRWVTYHGICLNIDLDLSPYDEITACGLEGKGITTLARELHTPVNVTDVETALGAAFAEVYGAKLEVGVV